MNTIPQEALDALASPASPPIFSTVSPSGSVNSIYATCMWLYGDDSILVADNYFKKTKENIDSGSAGSILVITDAKKTYQFKGRLEYADSGAPFDFMKSRNPAHLPGHGAVVLKVSELYSGSEQLL